MRRPLHALASLLVFGLLTSGAAAQPQVQKLTLSVPIGAIGKINQAGLWKRSNCTGTLIAPDKVLTAAHCLRDQATGAEYPFDSLHFLPGFNKGAYLAHGRIKSVVFAGPVPAADADPAEKLSTDAALITLTEPLAIDTIPLADPKEVPKLVLHAGYMKRDPDTLTMTTPCGVAAVEGGMWISNCHAESGSSGGPILAVDAGGVSLAGIVIAVSNRGDSIVLPLALIPSLIADETDAD